MQRVIVRNMSSRACKVVVAAAAVAGAMAQGLDGTNRTAVSTIRRPKLGPLTMEDGASEPTEYSEGETTCALADGAMFELIAMCHERRWGLTADRDRLVVYLGEMAASPSPLVGEG